MWGQVKEWKCIHCHCKIPHMFNPSQIIYRVRTPGSLSPSSFALSLSSFPSPSIPELMITFSSFAYLQYRCLISRDSRCEPSTFDFLPNSQNLLLENKLARLFHDQNHLLLSLNIISTPHFHFFSVPRFETDCKTPFLSFFVCRSCGLSKVSFFTSSFMFLSHPLSL